MLDIKKKFKCLIGYSDHTLGINTGIHVASMGASVLEKHVKPYGVRSVDSFFSITIKQLKSMIKVIRENEKSNGNVEYEISKSSLKNLNGRRSLYVIKDIKKGEKFTNKNLKSIRPRYGIHPKFLNLFLGKKSSKNIQYGSRLKWEYIKK